jgi:hypothetical protein
MGAISQFTFSGDGHGNTPVTMKISMTEADFSVKGLGTSGAIMVAAFLPKCTYVPEYPLLASADTPSDNRALTSLNLSLNNLWAEGGKIVAEAIKVTNNAMAVVLAPFSCPSDNWLNCGCLLLSTG